MWLKRRKVKEEIGTERVQGIQRQQKKDGEVDSAERK